MNELTALEVAAKLDSLHVLARAKPRGFDSSIANSQA